jgi:ferric-dicitrate binding protein FerR (iron transport regulator)
VREPHDEGGGLDVTKPEQYEELTVLVSRLLDRQLDEAGQARLNELLLADPLARRVYLQMVDQEVEFGCRFVAEANRELAAQANVVQFDFAAEGAATRRMWFLRLAAAAVIVAAPLMVWLLNRPADREGSSAIVARIEPGRGEVQLLNQQGKATPLKVSTELKSASRVALSGKDAMASLVFPDASRVELSGPTEVSVLPDGTTMLQLHRGQLSAALGTNLSRAPFHLQTSNALVHVEGTHFTVRETAGLTEVSVETGRARLTRRADGREVEIKTGQFAVADGRMDWRVGYLPAEDGRWGEDFESGLPTGWRGQLVSEGLPPGSKHGLKAVRTQETYGTFYVVEPPPEWNNGLMALTTNSVLHLTYRMAKPTWLNVFMHTIPPNAAPGEKAMFVLRSAEFPGARTGWATVSIPFARFVRKVPDAVTGELQFKGGPPKNGERVCTIAFTAPHELDLVFDKIWVTPDGPAEETVQLLPTKDKAP